MKEKNIQEISKLMKSISHPIRYKILWLLQDEEMSVGELRKEINTSSSNITQHLNILRNQGIVDFRKEENFIYNRIVDRRINDLLKKVNQLYS